MGISEGLSVGGNVDEEYAIIALCSATEHAIDFCSVLIIPLV